ncbi:MAG: cytochrome P450 [Planctomycetota bacterium]
MSTPPDQATRSRPNYLEARVAPHPQPVYRALQQQCPAGRMLDGEGPFIFRYEDTLFALRHPEIFSAEIEVGLIGNQRPLIPLQVDPPRQTKYRKILDPLFSRKKVLELEPDLRNLANELIDRFADTGSCEFSRDFAVPYPCTAFLRLMGLPQADLELFLELKDGIIRPELNAGSAEEAGRVRDDAGKRTYAYFEEILDSRSQAPNDDLLSYFLSTEVDGAALTREEILDICFLFLIGGLDTVTSTLGCSFVYLAEHPDRRQQILDRPELIPSAVEELLRWETPVMQVIRDVKRDCKLGDVECKKGERVTLVLGSADVDPGEFPDPERVDFARSRNRHLAFGSGAHRCLGSHLARLELQVALEEFHRRIPHYAIKAGEKPRYKPAIREVSYLPLALGETKRRQPELTPIVKGGNQ